MTLDWVSSTKAQGAIVVEDNHTDPLKKIEFAITNVVFIIQAKSTGPWPKPEVTTTGYSCGVDDDVFQFPTGFGDGFTVPYSCTGYFTPGGDTNAARVTATVTIKDAAEPPNTPDFTARADVKY